jgi:hypothetical protein
MPLTKSILDKKLLMLRIRADNSLAILIGVPENDDPALHSLPAAFFNVAEFSKVLKEDIGLRQIKMRADGTESKESLLTNIRKWIDGSSFENIIFYYSGHGILDETFTNYFLSLRKTSLQDLETSAININELFAKLTKNNANVLVILDCCYSQNSFNTKQGFGNSLIMASSTYNEATKYPLNSEKSIFTECLIETIKFGVSGKNEKEYLTLKDIFDATSEKLANRDYPNPKLSDRGNMGDWEFVANKLTNTGKTSVDTYIEELEYLYAKLSECDETIIVDRCKVQVNAISFFKHLKNLVLERYPVILSKYLNELVLPDQDVHRTKAFYDSLFEVILSFMAFVITKDIMENNQVEKVRLSIIKESLNPTHIWRINTIRYYCLEYSGDLFVKELGANRSLVAALEDVETLFNKSEIEDLDSYRSALITFFGELAFFSSYSLLAVRLINLQKGFCPPFLFTHEVSQLKGLNGKPYSKDIIFTDKALHNGTVLLFPGITSTGRREFGKISESDEYLNLWPFIIDINGYEAKSDKPEIRLLAKTDTKGDEFFFEPTLHEKELKSEKLKGYREIYPTLPAWLKKIYFESLKKKLGITNV